MYTVWTYLIYLAVSIPVALVVGWILYKNGRVFLVEVFQGKEDLADSVNHLILVGFYLLTIGFVLFAIKIGSEPQGLEDAVEFVSTKVGLVLVVLGGLHFLNLLGFSRLRWRVRLVAPQQVAARPDGPASVSDVSRDTPRQEPLEHPASARELDSDDYYG